MRHEDGSFDHRRGSSEQSDAPTRAFPLIHFVQGRLLQAWMLALMMLFYPQGAFCWYKHQTLMPTALLGLSSSLQRVIEKPIDAPCPDEDRFRFRKSATELGLNRDTLLPPTSEDACRKKRPITGAEILRGPFVDDPDQGMDQDLDDSFDPQGYRKWMGGKKGPTSQGFRHMYFGGWELNRPITTFQIPFHAIGLAPDRAEIIALKARDLLRNGNTAWGFRILAWALHYIQDLAQPFHSVQIVSFQMIPWSEIMTWPPSTGFENLVRESTRTVANYHWALEDFVLTETQKGEKSSFADCLVHDSDYAMLVRGKREPKDLAVAVSEASKLLASDLGRFEIEYFGKVPMLRDSDFAHGKGGLNFDALEKTETLAHTRAQFRKTICSALANASRASKELIEWALHP